MKPDLSISGAILFDLSFLAPKIKKNFTCNHRNITSMIYFSSPLPEIAS